MKARIRVSVSIGFSFNKRADSLSDRIKSPAAQPVLAQWISGNGGWRDIEFAQLFQAWTFQRADNETDNPLSEKKYQEHHIFSLIGKALGTISRLPKVARACGCPPDLEYGEVAGMVPGANPSGRMSGQPEMRGHLEATTVRAFLVSAGLPKIGTNKEAHLHCRQCGAVLPIQ